MPYKRPIPERIPDYMPNYDSVQIPLSKGNVEFSVFSERKPFIPEHPLLQQPVTFYSPQVNYKQKGSLVLPNFEKLGAHKRTDKSFVMMDTSPARDNKMYRITDTWNLDKKESPNKLDAFVADKLQLSRLLYLSQSIYKQDNSEQLTHKDELSTASESTQGLKSTIVRTLNKRFTKTAHTGYNRTR
jgi:hypothetical protein